MSRAKGREAKGAQGYEAGRDEVPPHTDDDYLNPVEDAAVASDEGRSGPKPQKSQATQMVDLARDAGIDLFHSPDRAAFVTLERKGHRETWPVKSPDFGSFLRRNLYETTKKSASTQAVADARGTLEAIALFDGPEYPVHKRVAAHGESVLVDLCDPEWRAIEVTREGWRMVARPPVRFVRRRGMLPLPIPERGGDLAELLGLANADGENGALILGWLVGALSPKGPYPVLALHGEQGSGKSTAARMLRALVDPNAAPIRAEPKDARDLIIAASNGWVIALDNLSHVPPWLSDALCRLATGGGFSTRELYTDGEEAIFDAQRPVILNGIEEVATRGDLLSRAIVVRLATIPAEKRRTEAALWRAFEAAAGRMFGVLLGAVACALRRQNEVSPPGLPRMADFAAWVTAAEPALGLSDGAFMRAYDENVAAANELAIESSPVVPALRAAVAAVGGSWTGTAGDALEIAKKQANGNGQQFSTWPRSPKAMAGTLRRLAPNLRAVGFELTELPRKAGARLWCLREGGRESSLSSPSSRSSHGGLPPDGDDGDANDGEDSALEGWG